MKCQFDRCFEKVKYRVSYDTKHTEDDHFMCKRHAESMRELADEVIELEQPKETGPFVCSTNVCKKRERSRRRKLAV